MSKSNVLSAAKLNEVFGETDVLIVKTVRGNEDFSCVSGDLIGVGVEMACLLGNIGERVSDDKNTQIGFVEAICKAAISRLSEKQDTASRKEEPEVGMMDEISGMTKIIFDKPDGTASGIRIELKGNKPELFSGLCFLMEELARNEAPDDLDGQRSYLETACQCAIQTLVLWQKRKSKKE